MGVSAVDIGQIRQHIVELRGRNIQKLVFSSQKYGFGALMIHALPKQPFPADFG